MRKKNYKGRCEKKTVTKSKEVCRTYDTIQTAYVDVLQNNSKIQSIQCNVLLKGIKNDEYVSDFVCMKTNGELMVRECVFQKMITKPKTIELLDISREYWSKRGVSDWGLVINEE